MAFFDRLGLFVLCSLGFYFFYLFKLSSPGQTGFVSRYFRRESPLEPCYAMRLGGNALERFHSLAMLIRLASWQIRIPHLPQANGPGPISQFGTLAFHNSQEAPPRPISHAMWQGVCLIEAFPFLSPRGPCNATIRNRLAVHRG